MKIWRDWALRSQAKPLPTLRLARHLGLSPTYLAKITRMLGKADILVSRRGAGGGVTLARSPREINLLEVVEACQGVVARNYCREVDANHLACGYHHAMVDLRESIRASLARWTLEDMLQPAAAAPETASSARCLMAGVVSLGAASGARSQGDSR